MQYTHEKQAVVPVIPGVTYAAVVGQILARKRTFEGLDQAQLANALGITQSSWSRIETGASALSVEQLKRTADYLKVRPEDIISDAEHAVAFLMNRGVRVTFSRQETDERGQLFAYLGAAALGSLLGAALTQRK